MTGAFSASSGTAAGRPSRSTNSPMPSWRASWRRRTSPACGAGPACWRAGSATMCRRPPGGRRGRGNAVSDLEGIERTSHVRRRPTRGGVVSAETSRPLRGRASHAQAHTTGILRDFCGPSSHGRPPVDPQGGDGDHDPLQSGTFCDEGRGPSVCRGACHHNQWRHTLD